MRQAWLIAGSDHFFLLFRMASPNRGPVAVGPPPVSCSGLHPIGQGYPIATGDAFDNGNSFMTRLTRHENEDCCSILRASSAKLPAVIATFEYFIRVYTVSQVSPDSIHRQKAS